jgi:hypothetical protein
VRARKRCGKEAAAPLADSISVFGPNSGEQQSDADPDRNFDKAMRRDYAA